MNLIRVIRPNDSVIVSIIQEKETGKFRFVNLTKNHICSCLFDTFDDAVQDLKTKKINKEIIAYHFINNDEINDIVNFAQLSLMR